MSVIRERLYADPVQPSLKAHVVIQ